MSCGVAHRRGSDLVLVLLWLWLWLWLWLATVAPIRPLAWELPYAAGTALEKAERQKKRTKKLKVLKTNSPNTPTWRVLLLKPPPTHPSGLPPKVPVIYGDKDPEKARSILHPNQATHLPQGSMSYKKNPPPPCCCFSLCKYLQLVH